MKQHGTRATFPRGGRSSAYSNMQTVTMGGICHARCSKIFHWTLANMFSRKLPVATHVLSGSSRVRPFTYKQGRGAKGPGPNGRRSGGPGLPGSARPALGRLRFRSSRTPGHGPGPRPGPVYTPGAGARAPAGCGGFGARSLSATWPDADRGCGCGSPSVCHLGPFFAHV